MYKIFEQPFDYNTLDCNVVLIDVLRAATVASVVVSKKPVVYFMSSNEDEIFKIKNKNKTAVTIGRRQKHSYTYPNSPSVIWDADLNRKIVLHNSAACGGMLDKLKNHNVLLCGFSNLSVTAEQIQKSNLDWSVVCCGFRGEERNDEDKLCAEMLCNNVVLDQNDLYSNLKESESLSIFKNNKKDYPKKDIDLCLSINMFSKAMQVNNNIVREVTQC